MELKYFKVLLVLNSWLLANGSPLAMLQATSSQSIVFHQPQASTSARPTITPPQTDDFSESQPKYEYKYEVSDQETGDRKSHWESRDGDKVRGVYTLYEPDGALRTVEYTADALHGFNAIVSRNEPSKHQHSRSSGRKNLSSVHSGYDQPSGDYTPDQSVFSTKTHDNDLGRSVKPYNQGVDYSIVHGDKCQNLNSLVVNILYPTRATEINMQVLQSKKHFSAVDEMRSFEDD